MSYLFYCPECQRCLNKRLYSKECTEAHTAPDRNLCAQKCEHGILRNCSTCNPYTCPCGRVVANNKYTIAVHESSKYHIRHMKNKNLL